MIELFIALGMFLVLFPAMYYLLQWFIDRECRKELDTNN